MTGWLNRRDRVAVLGVRLVPLTLGHLFLLDELDIDSGMEWTASRLRVAVVACALPAQEARKTLFSSWLPVVASLWKWRTRKADYSAELGEFLDWYNEQCSGPDVIRDSKGSSDEFAAPMHLSLLAIAMHKFHMTEEVAMQMPVRKLRQMIVALGEVMGEIKPWTHKHERLKAMGERFKNSKQETALN